ncbi:Nn.00g045470.m01.CDS01 [Neocucurbitaria sp. VM-36]
MAEAYRPHPKKIVARADANSSSSASRTSSSLSRKSIGSMSIKSFSPFRRKTKRTSLMSKGSMSSSQLESQQESILEFHHEDEGEAGERPSSASTSLPELPPNEPLPQEDTDDYDAALESAVHELQNDFTSGARQLAESSLVHLAHVTDIAACMATSWGEFWALMVHATKHLSSARPSMSAAITACLLRALERIARMWNEEQAKGVQSTSELARIAGGTFDAILRERRELSGQLGLTFTNWLHNHCSEVLPHSLRFDQVVRADSPQRILAQSSVRILTLSNSSTIRAAILHAISSLPDVIFHLTVLECRPRCEGADMAAQIYASVRDKDRLSIQVIPDCAVGTASSDIDIVLLGADRISSTGDVSNKIGSLAAAICAKQLNKNVAVVALSDVEKIAAPGQDNGDVERHPSSELTSAWTAATRNQLEGKANVEVFGEWFEWVPANLIDLYITERGVLGTEDVERIAKEMKELDEYIFQEKKA